MNLPCRRVNAFTAALAFVIAAAGPAAAQSITVVSPHAGEAVDSWRPYIVRWTAGTIPGIADFNVYAVGATETEGICTAAPSARACEWFEPAIASPVNIVIEARDAGGTVLASAESGPFELEFMQLGSEWISQDVGDVGRSGGARGSEADFMPTEVWGAGGDIWGTADAFHYTFREMPVGDYDATATITAIEGTEAWTKAGLMIRYEYSQGSPHHFLLASRGKGIAYQRRLTEGGESLHTSVGTSSALPVRVEAMRRNGYTEMYVKQGDGPWRPVTSFEGEGMLLVGLAVTSHDRSTIATGRFADVRVDIGELEVEILKPDAFVEVQAGEPYTIEWTQQQPMHPATVSFTVDGGLTWTVIPGCDSIVANTCLWRNPGPESERARVRVVVHDPDNRRAWAATYPFSIRADPVTTLPDGWESGDIGAVGAAGTASYSPEAAQFIIEGSGADVWGTADEFHFVSRTAFAQSHGYEITARVASVENVNRWTKVGLMVRTDRGSASPHAALFVTPTTEKGVAFQRRRAQGGASVHTSGPAITAPIWLKLVVKPDGLVRAFYRARTPDPWTFAGEDRIPLGSSFSAGLAVSSHVDGVLATAVFDNVSFQRFGEYTDEDIGAVGVAGTVAANDIGVTLEGSGADIWNNADAFRFRHTSMPFRATLSARVRSIEATHAWAKGGVMIRKNATPGSPHVMLIVSPGKGIAMQYRAVENGPSANVAIAAGTAPEWVRLVRDANDVVGEASDDGMTWRRIGSVTIQFDTFKVLGGLAVTSHNNSTLATGVFDDVLLLPR